MYMCLLMFYEYNNLQPKLYSYVQVGLLWLGNTLYRLQLFSRSRADICI